MRVTFPAPPTTLFGVPQRLERADAEALLAALCAAWEAQYGALKPLKRDLRKLHQRLFDPNAREFTIRRALADDLPAAGDADLPRGLRVDAGSGQLIAPEGRIVIELLEHKLAGPGDVEFNLADIAAAEHVLMDAYRSWLRARQRRVVAMVAGDEAPLLPAPIGVVLSLLLEGAIGYDRALVQNRDRDDREDEQPLIHAVVAFARALDPKSRLTAEALSLYGGYALSEARRRLQSIVLDPAGRRPGEGPPKRVYIAEGHEAEVLGFVSRELVRREVPTEEVANGLEQMAQAYRELATPDRAGRVAERAPALARQLAELMAPPGT